MSGASEDDRVEPTVKTTTHQLGRIILHKYAHNMRILPEKGGGRKSARRQVENEAACEGCIGARWVAGDVATADEEIMIRVEVEINAHAGR